MQTFLSSLQGVLTIVFILAMGYFLTKLGWFDQHTSDLFAKLVVNVTLPLYMIVNITSTFTKENLIHSGRGLLIPFLSILISYLIAVFAAKIFRVNKNRKGLSCAIF